MLIARGDADLRACIGCNPSCIGRAHKGLSISCIRHRRVPKQHGRPYSDNRVQGGYFFTPAWRTPVYVAAVLCKADAVKNTASPD